MNLTQNTILITGGTAGIGLGLALKFAELGNTVIVTGRDPAKLAKLRQSSTTLHTIESDVTDSAAIQALHSQVTRNFPELNILVNNAGIMRKLDLQDAGRDLADITREIDTNLVAPIRMTQRFLPHLKARPAAAIINVSSGLAYVPLPISPVYSATKAAIHSFTSSLRIQLKNTSVKVFELAPPGTDTALFSGDFDAEDIDGMKPMSVQKLVDHAVNGLRKDRLEIRPGVSNVLYAMSRLAPHLILSQLGKSVDRMIAHGK